MGNEHSLNGVDPQWKHRTTILALKMRLLLFSRGRSVKGVSRDLGCTEAAVRTWTGGISIPRDYRWRQLARSLSIDANVLRAADELPAPFALRFDPEKNIQWVELSDGAGVPCRTDPTPVRARDGNFIPEAGDIPKEVRIRGMKEFAALESESDEAAPLPAGGAVGSLFDQGELEPVDLQEPADEEDEMLEALPAEVVAGPVKTGDSSDDGITDLEPIDVPATVGGDALLTADSSALPLLGAVAGEADPLKEALVRLTASALLKLRPEERRHTAEVLLEAGSGERVDEALSESLAWSFAVLMRLRDLSFSADADSDALTDDAEAVRQALTGVNAWTKGFTELAAVLLQTAPEAMTALLKLEGDEPSEVLAARLSEALQRAEPQALADVLAGKTPCVSGSNAADQKDENPSVSAGKDDGSVKHPAEADAVSRTVALLLPVLGEALRRLPETELRALDEAIEEGRTRVTDKAADHDAELQARNAVRNGLARRLALMLGVLPREPAGWFDAQGAVTETDLDAEADRENWLRLEAPGAKEREAYRAVRTHIEKAYFGHRGRSGLTTWFLPEDAGKSGMASGDYFRAAVDVLLKTPPEDFFLFLRAAVPESGSQPEAVEKRAVDRLGKACSHCGTLKDEPGSRWHVVGRDLSREYAEDPDITGAKVLCGECWDEEYRPVISLMKRLMRLRRTTAGTLQGNDVQRLMLDVLIGMESAIAHMTSEDLERASKVLANVRGLECDRDRLGVRLAWFLTMLSRGAFKRLETVLERRPEEINSAMLESESAQTEFWISSADPSRRWLLEYWDFARFAVPRAAAGLPASSIPAWFRGITNPAGEITRRLRNVPPEDLLRFLDGYAAKQ